MINASDFGKIKDFKNWTLEKFRHMCILSGCDYVSSIHGIGLKTATKYLQGNINGYKLIESWKKFGKLVKAPNVPTGYLEEFTRADLTFLHQRVFDPVSNSLVCLTPVNKNDGIDWDTVDYIGPLITNDIACGIAYGEIDPCTKLPYNNLFGISTDKENIKESNFSTLELSENFKKIYPNSSSNNTNKVNGYKLPRQIPIILSTIKPINIMETISTKRISDYFTNNNKELKRKFTSFNRVSSEVTLQLRNEIEGEKIIDLVDFK